MKLRKKINKIPLLLIFLLIILLTHWYKIKDKYIINPSKSLTRGIYKLYPPVNIKHGDIVVFKIPKELEIYCKHRGYILNRTETLMKRVAAFSTDTIEIKNQEIFINNVSWGKIYNVDSKYRDLPQLKTKDVIPNKNEFLPLVQTDGSFDGRYFGPIKSQEIQARAELFLQF